MLRLLESFDFYGDSGRTGSTLNTDIARRHQGGTILAGTDGDLITGRGGDNLALRFRSADTNNRIFLTRFDPTQSDTWIVGFAMRTGDDPSAAFIKFFEAWDFMIRMYIAFGALYITSDDWARPEPLNYALKPDRWYYIEIKVYFHNSSGTITVRVNEQTVYTASGKDTLPSGQEPGVFMLGSPDDNISYDDIYVCDDTGSYNNDFLGVIKVETLRPNSDDTTNWTPSGGSNHYELVDSSNLWQTTDYVEANGANIDDIWEYENLTKVTGSIHGVQLITSAWSDTGMPQPLKLVCESGNTTVYSDARGMGVEADYAMPHEYVWETDPDTSNAWTSAGINAALFGVRKV